MLLEEATRQNLYMIKQAMVGDEEYFKETIEGTRLEAIKNIAKYQKQTKKIERQQNSQEKHTRRRPGTQEKT